MSIGISVKSISTSREYCHGLILKVVCQGERLFCTANELNVRTSQERESTSVCSCHQIECKPPAGPHSCESKYIQDTETLDLINSVYAFTRSPQLFRPADAEYFKGKSNSYERFE